MTNLAVSVGSSIANFLRIPSSADSVGTFPSGKVFGCPKRRTHNQNHPTSDYKLSWLFYKCYECTALRAVQSSPWKQCACHTPRTGLNRVKCTIAERNAQSTSEWPKTLPRGFKGPQPLGTPFSSIFRRAAKDGAAGGPNEKRMLVKTGKNQKFATKKGAPLAP